MVLFWGVRPEGVIILCSSRDLAAGDFVFDDDLDDDPDLSTEDLLEDFSR